MRYGFMIFVIHVSGTRMIEQGTDGLSQGLFNQGALATGKIRLYAPINLSALDRTMNLKPWIITWAPTNALFLLLSQWFVESHDIRWSGEGSLRKLCYSRAFYI